MMDEAERHLRLSFDEAMIYTGLNIHATRALLVRNRLPLHGIRVGDLDEALRFEGRTIRTHRHNGHSLARS